ncbi:MAG TPA: MFS transporter [Dehalococcoidia bacterium]|nr:MFS transporter [Dehalococcoidia bacterium]
MATKDAAAPPEPQVAGVPRPVFLFGIVSLFTDISSEMIYPLTPLFLTAVVGAPVAAVGIIEGVAESTASLSKTISGWLSDRWLVRKPLIIAGYALSAVAKPLLGASTVWPAALGARFTDRLGKGVRSPPRDALMGDVAEKGKRGRAFGFHRAMDSAGAVIGPALGLGLFELLRHHYRPVFFIAFIPALIGVCMLFLVKEHKPKPRPGGEPSVPLRELGTPFYVFLGISLVFALGNSSDAFLILRSNNIGLTEAETVSAYVLYNAVYTAASFPAGILSDRVGRRNVIAPGFVIFGLVYLGFAAGGSVWAVWPLFAVYGLYIAATDAVGKAFVVDFAPAAARATALGLYTGATGAMILASSVIAGVLWDEIGPSAPFVFGAATGFAAAALLFVMQRMPAGRAV